MRITEEMFVKALQEEYCRAVPGAPAVGKHAYLDRLPAANVIALNAFVYPEKDWNQDNLSVIRESLVRLGQHMKFVFDT